MMINLSIQEVSEKLEQAAWNLENVHDDSGEADELRELKDSLEEDLRELGMKEEPEG